MSFMPFNVHVVLKEEDKQEEGDDEEEVNYWWYAPSFIFGQQQRNMSSKNRSSYMSHIISMPKDVFVHLDERPFPCYDLKFNNGKNGKMIYEK